MVPPDLSPIVNGANESPANAPAEKTSFLARWSRDPARWHARLHLAIFVVLVAGSMFAALLVDWPVSLNYQLREGDISPIDIRAPRPLTYRSEVLTELERQRAAAAVPKVYDPPQTRVARQQLARANLILDFIKQVRLDPYADPAQKVAWLRGIADVTLPEQVIGIILSLSDERWNVVREETLRVLDTAMRNVIREGELQNAQRAVPGLISFGLSDDEALVVSALVQGLLRPNTFYNPERTAAAQAEAAARVPPVEHTIAAGETILRAGDRVEALDLEILEALGLLRDRRTWQDYVSALLLTALLTGLQVAYIAQSRRGFWKDRLRVLLLGVLFAVFVFLGKAMVPMHTVLPYLYPLPAMTMLVAALISLPIATVSTLVIAVLLLLFTNGETAIAVYALAGALAGALALGRGERLNGFAWAGVWIIVADWVTLMAFRLYTGAATDSRGLLELTVAAAINGIFASSFTLVVFYLLGQVFGLATSLQLLELSRPTHPLLRQLLLKAPGTYYHTLIVSNMAEEAAAAIGADALLTRVGSYYHDIGKTVRPYFFIENYTEGGNPHDRLDPYTSARIIINHVADGVELARKYRLPEVLIDFIREHHGTTRVEYFYHQACQEAPDPAEVDEKAFRYPGPKPRRRETAILMLADGCEATVRAMNPRTHEEMADLIRSVINRRLVLGQLDESRLTLYDLTLIAEAFTRVLKGVHHPRIQYPGAPAAVRPLRRSWVGAPSPT
ncbi:MAG: HDIG domain-containing protein [Caldilineales bacterium]|nr:HDIG domain-containing protein [Caldilineales bacterium]